jgi:nucleoside-diphosphate-sugar epimerase
MRILITGVNGLLGRKLTEQLIDKGLQVLGIVHKLNLERITGVTFVEVDFSKDWGQDELPNEIDVVIHLAQSSRFRDFPNSALDTFNVNVSSTARLLDYAKRVGAKQFIYASSGGVYGNGSKAFKENDPIVPAKQLGYYLGSKACGEILAQSYASVFQVTVIRPFFIYGPGQNRSMLIPRLMDYVSLGKPISLQGSEGIRINPVHVEDASAALVAALNTKESATYNIAGPDVISIRRIAEAMGEHLGKEPTFQQAEGEPKDLIADISAMQSKLHKPVRHLVNSLREIQD